MNDKTELYKDAEQKRARYHALSYQNTMGLKPEERIQQGIDYRKAEADWMEAESKARA